jgi:hypothetical protein
MHEFGNPGKDLKFESVIKKLEINAWDNKKWAITTFLNPLSGNAP